MNPASLVQVVLSLVLSLAQEGCGHLRQKTADCSRANGQSLHEPTVHDGANVHPLHKLVVNGELTRCDFFLNQIESASLNINEHHVLYKISLRTTRVDCTLKSYSRACDDYLARFFNAYQLLLLSFAS